MAIRPRCQLISPKMGSNFGILAKVVSTKNWWLNTNEWHMANGSHWRQWEAIPYASPNMWANENSCVCVCCRQTKMEKLWQNSVTCCRPNSESRNEKTKQKQNMQIRSLNFLVKLINIQTGFIGPLRPRCDFSTTYFTYECVRRKNGENSKNSSKYDPNHAIYGALIVPN